MRVEKLHSEELNDLCSYTKYCAVDKIENNGLGKACSQQV
jgi:hypothetical protein